MIGAAPLERIDRLEQYPWLDGPGQYIVSAITEELLCEPTFQYVFGEFIDGYQREDYGMRNLPALRCYSLTGKKTSEDWFFDGEITIDALYPPRIRRKDLMAVPAMVTSALIQQFRRMTPEPRTLAALGTTGNPPEFFDRVRAKVPGLNRLGREVGYDHSLALKIADDLCPVSQHKLDYRVDLRQWDAYLEQTNRTKQDPFEATLTDLRSVLGSIQGLRDDGTTEVSIPAPTIQLGGS
jgi:hypothetical protein